MSYGTLMACAHWFRLKHALTRLSTTWAQFGHNQLFRVTDEPTMSR